MACTWLTIQEAADWFKVHRCTIERYIKKGQLKANRPSERVIRICLGDLSELGAEKKDTNG